MIGDAIPTRYQRLDSLSQAARQSHSCKTRDTATGRRGNLFDCAQRIAPRSREVWRPQSSRCNREPNAGSVPFDDADAVEYAKIRQELETAGIVIGPYDLQIAAICVRHGLTLVTSNIGEFSRVHGLMVEDWLTAADSP